MAGGEGAGVMARLAAVRSWPLAWKVPLLVAGLMVGIAALISEVVLNRLRSDQETNLRLLTSAYLDGVSTTVLPTALRGDTWEAFDALDRARSRYSGVDVRYAIVVLPNDKVLAASDPVRFPCLPKCYGNSRRKMVCVSTAKRLAPG
jgi:hypothetical protein